MIRVSLAAEISGYKNESPARLMVGAGLGRVRRCGLKESLIEEQNRYTRNHRKYNSQGYIVLPHFIVCCGAHPDSTVGIKIFGFIA
jgi:hypothetical protein